MEEKPIQETTSTYFNNILNKEILPITIEQVPKEIINLVDKIVEQGFPDEADEVKERINYIIPYILQAIDWKEYGIPLEAWQLKYYYQRERFLKKTGLKYEEFLNHEYLQNAIHELGLKPEPVFEFILFLKYYFDLRSELRYSPVEQLEKLKEALKRDTDKISMEVIVDGRHFKFTNSNFILNLINSTEIAQFKQGAFNNDFNEGSSREKIRALDYYLVKTLLDYLPIKVESRRGQYTQAERNFALSVLNYTGRLVGDEPEFLCGFENNATFDKLMRDFKNQPIPFAMELFL